MASGRLGIVARQLTLHLPARLAGAARRDSPRSTVRHRTGPLAAAIEKRRRTGSDSDLAGRLPPGLSARSGERVGLELPILGKVQRRRNVARNAAPEYAVSRVKDLLLILLHLAIVIAKPC